MVRAKSVGLFMLTFFIIIAVSGTLGGLIFALDSLHNHNLCIPWDGKEINTGWLGHVIVGIGGAIVTIGAAVPVFRMDITPVAEYHLLDTQPPTSVGLGASSVPNQQLLLVTSPEAVTEKPPSLSAAQSTTLNGSNTNNLASTTIVNFTKKDSLELILYLLALGIIGGYSGLRIISGMSDAMIKKLEKEVDDKVKKTQEDFHEENQKLRNSLATSLSNDRIMKAELKTQKESNNLIKAAFLIKTGKADEGIEILQKLKEESSGNKDKISMWLGSGYRQLKKYEQALKYGKEASTLNPNEWSYPYNCACYLSLMQQDENQPKIVNYLKEAIERLRNDTRYDDLNVIEDQLTNDKDLDFVRQKMDLLTLLAQD